ncbi:MAG TPA: NADH-quinone oxidoreductase subunit J [Alphaproteobacteria bacterium]
MAILFSDVNHMPVTTLLFYVFAATLLLSSVVVITARNAVHSVLFLILAFFNGAALFVMLGAEYLAMLLVIVYVGAVAVLFLFVVMMLDIKLAERRSYIKKHLPAGLIVGFAFLAELVFVMKNWTVLGNDLVLSNRAYPVAHADSIGSAKALGEMLYTHYLYPFQLAGLILLLGMVGAIVLTQRRRAGIRRQSSLEQVLRRPQDVLELTRPESGAGVTSFDFNNKNAGK